MRRLLLWGTMMFAASPSCTRAIVVEVYPEAQRSRREVALIVASNGSGNERVDITNVDERGIYEAFTSDRIWIEVLPGTHVFTLGLAWSRSPSGSFYAVPLQADVEAGRCYRPVLGPLTPSRPWQLRERHLEVISCPPRWRSFPRQKRKADAPPMGM